MSQSRKRRGAATQRIAAEYFAEHGWPYATARGAGEPGTDIMHVDGVAPEVKGRRSLDLPGWLRQAAVNAGTDLPVLIVRGDGQGPASVASWAFIVTFADGVRLLRDRHTLDTVADALADRDDHDTIAAYIAKRGAMP